MLAKTAKDIEAPDTRTDLRKAFDALPGYSGAVTDTVKLLAEQGKVNKYKRPYGIHAVYGVLRGKFHNVDVAEALISILEAEQKRRHGVTEKAAKLVANA